MKEVVILRGIPGSGKSRYARDHCLASAVVCSADDYFMVGGEYEFDPTKLAIAHVKCMGKFIDALHRGDVQVVVDNTCVHLWEFENYMKIGADFGYEVNVVDFRVLTTEHLKVCIERNVHGVPADIIARMALEFEPYEDATALDVFGESV